MRNNLTSMNGAGLALAMALLGGTLGMACKKDTPESMRQEIETPDESRSAEAQPQSQQPQRPLEVQRRGEVTMQERNDEAIAAIAQARCEREQRCGNIGGLKEYRSVDVCLETVKNDWEEDLNRLDCPGGIVQKELDECLREVRNNDCDSPLDTLERVIACRESDICKST